MSTVNTYNILSFCTNCHFCFLINFFFQMSSLKSCIRRKSQSFLKSLKSTPRQNLESNFQPLCHVKGVDRGTVWHIARWKTLVVVPYDILAVWAFERRHYKKKINQKTKMAICTKRENGIGVNRRHFYQVVAVQIERWNLDNKLSNDEC
jgi:hypothetical protein